MEEKSISFRGKVRLISYISFALIALTIFSISQSVKVKRYEREILISQQRALISLDEYLSEISADLEKSVYISTPEMFSNIATELWRDSAEAKNSLSTLPTSDSSVANTYKFLSQIGEYVMSIQRKAMNGQALSDEERNELLILSEYANTLSEKLNNMCYGMQNGTFSFEKSNNMFLKSTDYSDDVFNKMDDVDQTLSDIPSLVFDGPFSSHIENASPKMLKGKEEITKAKANTLANKICESKDLSFSFEENGTIPCYVFKDENFTVAITKNGGYPYYMLGSIFAGEESIKQEDAVKIAKEYLKNIGYTNMQESYYFTEDGICTVNFAYAQNSTVCYADLIKVSVNLQTGKVNSFDATGYLSSHTERSIPKASFSAEDGRTKLYNGLTVNDFDTCFIPTEWGTEKYCYEYVCTTNNGQHLLVYLNAVTGEEENILIMLFSDDGVLTK